jgi:hypothetical protein
MSTLAPAPTKPPIQLVTKVIFLRIKWPWGEDDHSSTSSAKVKDEWSYTSYTLCMPSEHELEYPYIYFHTNMTSSERAVYLALNTSSEQHAFSHSCVLTIDTNLSSRI